MSSRAALVALAAYATVLIQVSLLAAWPMLGGQPHLIALGAVGFLVAGRHDWGLVWMLVGGSLVDLLLPIPFGTTLLPLLIAYGLLQQLSQRFVEVPTWTGTILFGLFLVAVTELPITIMESTWRQLGWDVRASLLFLLPIAYYVVEQSHVRRQGLTVHR